jgi:UDP-N-acetyl-D-glucosamine dehydrogenase
MKVVIVGQGYVGLPLAMSICEAGHNVIGFDLNSKIVTDLNSGISHIEDIEANLLSNAVTSGKYRATTNPSDIVQSDIAIIAVPTPLDENREPDLRYVISASETLGKFLTKRTLIINESTSYPGTLRDVIAPTVLKNSSASLSHLFAISPERVDPGNKDWKIANTPRIFAGLTEEASKLTKSFYSGFCGELIQVSSPEVAESAKLFENTFRQVNIALVNEFSHITHALGISIREVLDAAESKPYGFMRFNPGLGVGGHCIPVDPSYLSFLAKKVNQTADFVDLANSVNLMQPFKIAERVKNENGGSLSGKRIVLIGMSYKPNVVDIRESPSIRLIELLRDDGASVVWNDTLLSSWNGEKSVSLKDEMFDIAILAIFHTETDLIEVKNCANYLFDCTGLIEGASQL